jgi:hypothetical protein
MAYFYRVRGAAGDRAQTARTHSHTCMRAHVSTISRRDCPPLKTLVQVVESSRFQILTSYYRRRLMFYCFIENCLRSTIFIVTLIPRDNTEL